MSNARDTETSHLTPEQKQRAEALRIAGSLLSRAFSSGSPDDLIALADYILTGLHLAEFVDDAPEPEAGDASATEKATKVTECQWPGCWADVRAILPPTLTLRLPTYDYLQPACALHAGRSLTTA